MNKQQARKMGVLFEDDLKERLEDPKFRAVWEASEADYQDRKSVV